MRGRGLNACSVVIKKYRTVCCSVKTNKGRLVRAAGGCGEGFGACESGCRCAGVCTRVSKKRGRVLAKTNLRRRKSGRSLRRGDAVAVVGYREVVKREFARENPPSFKPLTGCQRVFVRQFISAQKQTGRRTKCFWYSFATEKTSRVKHVIIRHIKTDVLIRYLKTEKSMYEIKIEKKNFM